jgi:beta-galactosidase/beta-glucuronidase
MKKKFNLIAERFCKQIILAAVFSGIIICECQSINKSVSMAALKDQESVRKIRELSGNWRFQLDVRNIGEKEHWFANDLSEWGKVTVPGAWDCYEDALWQYQGIGWYTTIISPDDFTPMKKTEIVFGRVMYYSKVWLNGEFIGENIGGYLPFRFDITKYLKPGQDNKLVVRVDNRARIEWLPASEQIEWIQYGGILEPVKLVSTSQTYIDDIIVRTIPDNGGAGINCIISIANETAKETEMDLNIGISLHTGIVNKSVKVRCKANGNTKVNVDFTLAQAELWSPGTPVLYTAAAILTKNGSKIDDLTDRFGIRQVSVKGTSILLNGKPIIIKGSHRYDAYDRFGPNPPEKLLREELALMKSVGINTIRVHYPQSPALISLFDEYGFMMMEEIPLNWWGNKWKGMKSIGGEAEQSLDILVQAKSTLTDMIRRDKNHPCIVIWSMANECATTNETGITVMRELLKLAKSLDPARLVTFVAGGDPTKHLGFDEADIICFNEYFICDHISQIDSVVYERLTKDLALFRNNFPDKPIVMTEFGRQGIKDIHGDVFYSEEFQAHYIESNWKALKENPSISGGIVWTWADYFHELHFTLHTSYGFYGIIPANYGPFGVVTGDRRQKKSLEALARMYGGSIPGK